MTVHAACDIGLVRSRNEDMLLAAGRLIRDAAADFEIDPDAGDPCFFAVADGLGGEAAGDIASETALRFYRDRVSRIPAGLSPRELRTLFSRLASEAHEAVCASGREDLRGMGTTLTAFLLYAGGWFWVNIGDTRAWRYRGGRLERLSRDHTLREASGRPDIPSNILVNCLGGGAENVYCDFGDVPGFPGGDDALMLTSDGLHDLLGDEIIRSLVRGNPGNPVQALVGAAKRAGGGDNISCLYIAENG